MKKIGASCIAIGAFSNNVSSQDNSGSITVPDIETVQLSRWSVLRSYAQARSRRPVAEMLEFLSNKRGLNLEYRNISGFQVDGAEIQKHNVLRLPIHGDQNTGQEQKLGRVEIREYDRSATAEVLLGDDVYWSSPNISSSLEGNSQNVAQNTDVVQALDWESRQDSNEIGLARTCMTDPTFDAGGPACTFVSGLTAVAGGVLMLIPEPGSTAIGVVAISSVLAGSCTIMKAIDEVVDCNVTEIGFCITYPKWNSLPKAYLYPVDCQ